ncbi:MAG TPA: hypothetical protein VFS19_05645 [Planctomycetota bacterium]|nr:hypothetical protein [Planctomycetota bacterium]
MKGAIAALTALLCLSAAPPQEKPAKPSLLWAKSWTDALAEATIRNVPIYLTIHKDG